MAESIQDLISEYVQDTGLARLETQGGVRGVLFLDENEFFPWRDLGFNHEYGFFRLSAFPNVTNEAEYATWTIHPVEVRQPEDDNWQPCALLDADGFGFLLGERWQVEELLPVLQAFLERGETAEPIDEYDEALGERWFTINEACNQAHEFDPDKYPLDDNLSYRIRQVARRGNWIERGIARQTGTGTWLFHNRRFRHWLIQNADRQYDKN